MNGYLVQLFDVVEKRTLPLYIAGWFQNKEKCTVLQNIKGFVYITQLVLC